MYGNFQITVFQALVLTWEHETMFTSNITKLYEHPHVERIINMGLPILPVIIEHIRGNKNMLNIGWFHILREITGQNPVQEKNKGKVISMAEDWINWFDNVYMKL